MANRDDREKQRLAQSARREAFETSGQQQGPGRPFKYSTEEQVHEASIERFERAWGSGMTQAQGGSLYRFEESWGLPLAHASYHHAANAAAAQRYAQQYGGDGTAGTASPSFVRSSEGPTMTSTFGGAPGAGAPGAATAAERTAEKIADAVIRPSQKAVDAVTRAEASLKSAQAAMLRVEASERRRAMRGGGAGGGGGGGGGIGRFSDDADYRAQGYGILSRREQSQLAGGGGMFGGLLGMVTPGNISMAMGMGGTAIRSIAEASNSLQNPFLTSGQQMFGALNSVTLGSAGLAREVARNWHGDNAELGYRSFQHELGQTSIHLEEEGERRKAALRLTALSAQNRQRAVEDNRIPGRQGFDRLTSEGQIAYNEYQRTRPIEVQAARLRQDLAEARLNAGPVQREFDLRRNAMEFSRQSHALAISSNDILRARGETNPLTLQAAARRVSETGTRYQERLTSYQQFEQTNRGQLDTLAERESAARRGLVDVLQDQLSKEKERESRTRGAAATFGFMAPGDRQQYTLAAEMVHQHGWGNVPPEMQQMYAMGSPAAARRQAEQFGINTPEFQAARRRGDLPGVDADFGSIGRQATLETAIDLQINFDPERLAQDIARNLNANLQGLLDSITAQGRERLQQLESNQMLQNASR
jgi:hypothetical protein